MAKYSGELFDAPPAVADSAPPPPVAEAPAPVASAPSTPQEVFASRKTAGLTPVQVVARNIGEAAAVPANAMNTASDAVVKFLGENPDLPANVIGLLGAGYGIKKARENFATLDEKMATSPTKVNAPAPVNTPSSWDIHNRVEPTLGTPSTVLSLDEVKARIAGVTPAPVPNDSMFPKPVLFNDPDFGTPKVDTNIPAYQRKGITFAGTTPAGQPAAPLAPVIDPAQAAPVTYVQPGQSFATTPNEFVGPPAPIRPNPEDFVGPMRPVAPPPGEFIGPPRPIPDAGPNSTATKAVADTVTDLFQQENAPAGSAQPPKKRGPAPGTSTKIQLTPEQLGMKMPIGFGTGDTWLYNTLGPEKYQSFVQEVNQGKPFGNKYDLAQKAYQETYIGPKLPFKIAKQREIPRPVANFGLVPPELEQVGPLTKEALQNLKTEKATSSQKGGATIGGLANVGLNALGIAGLMSDFKEAKKTGDYSNFGLNATGQAIANFIPKLAIPFQLASYSKQLGESPEDLKALGKKLQDAQQAARVGAGRGIGVPPPR